MHPRTVLALLLAFFLMQGEPLSAARKDKKRKQQADPYAELVWPPPPAAARIKLEAVIRGRVDVEPKSGFGRKLLGASPQSPYDTLVKPFAAAFDAEGRVLVTDSGTAALIRFDRDDRRMDVLGTRGNVRLKLPLGVHVAPNGTIYVADAGLAAVVAFDSEGKVVGLIGSGELTNPTDVTLSPSGTKLYVADSKAHQIVVFDPVSGGKLATLGRPGDGDGEFGFPTSLAFGPEGGLYVVDQINARVQLLTEEGEYLDQLGGLGVGFGNFVRPKDVAVDEVGMIYVTDNAFNNVQLFDADFTLLTFIGSGGLGAGQFHGASGVAVSGPRLAVVDQLGRRVQLFRFLVSKEQDLGATDVAPRAAAAAEPEERAAPSPPRREPQEPRVAPAEPPSLPSPPVPEPASVAPQPTPEPAPVEPQPKPEPAPATPQPTPEPPVEPQGPSEPVAVAPEPQDERDAAGIELLMRDWAAAWAAQDVDRYLGFYDDEFEPEAMTREAWREQRRQRLSRPAFIEVKIENIESARVGPTKAWVSLGQEYRSDTYSNRVRKVLELRLRGGDWKIAAERAVPLEN